MARQTPVTEQGGNMPPIEPLSPPVPPLGAAPESAQPSTDAQYHPRRGNPYAYDAREEPERELDDMDIPVFGVGEARSYTTERIVVASEEELKRDYADRLLFDQDLLTIELDPPNEENAPQEVPVGVNGKFFYLPVGRRIKLPRCFVEVLAVAQPFQVQTKVTERPGADPINKLTRNARMRYPFTILADPSPHGRAWLRRVKQMA